MSKHQDNFKIINLWVERNLTQETVDGSLSKAFEVDGIIDQLCAGLLGHFSLWVPPAWGKPTWPNFWPRYCFLRRMIERHVTTAISDAIVRENPVTEDTIELSVRRNRIRARLLSRPLTPPIKLRQTVVLLVGTTKKIRNLELNQLLAEARALVDAAGNRLAELKNDRREATDLLTQINKPGFWDLIDHREEILDRYRTLDVAIRMRKRFIPAATRSCQGLE